MEQPPNLDPGLTLRALLAIGKGDIIQAVKEINDRYLYWDKVKYKAKSLNINPSLLWHIVKLSRQSVSSELQFGNTSFCYASTEYIQRSLHYFDLHIGGYLEAKSIVPESDKNRYLVSSIMEEAISSSQMEGANTTRKKAKEMLRKETRPKTRSEQMILNNYITVQYISKNSHADLTLESLLHIHGLITKDTLDDNSDEGQLRDSDDIHVVNYSNGEVVHTPPPYTELEDLIKDLCKFFNEDGEYFTHPVTKAIIIHFMIGWIHPFADGNGRTARALFYWYLLKKGYWLAEYLSISKVIQDSKNQYERAYLYTEHDENDITYFITYNLKILQKAFESLKNYIQKKQQENSLTAKLFQIPGINERQAQILKILYDNSESILTVKEIENRFLVSNFTARTDLKGLLEMGFLETIPVNKVKQNFVKSSRFQHLLTQYNIS